MHTINLFTQRPKLMEAYYVNLVNCEAFWEGCPVEYALPHMQSMYGQAMDAAKGKKVIITETGWPSKGENLNGAVPSEAHAKHYFINTQAWAKDSNVEVFYFSSFDEPWKGSPDPHEPEKHWGLFYENRNPKMALANPPGYKR